MTSIHIIRRIGSTPAQRGSSGGANCPDVLKIDGGYLVIGKILPATTDMRALLAAHGASIGDDEQAVIVPDNCMHDAADDIAHTYVRSNA